MNFTLIELSLKIQVKNIVFERFSLQTKRIPNNGDPNSVIDCPKSIL